MSVPRSQRRRRTRESRPPAVLVFGEDANDRGAIKELVLALRPDAPRIETRRKPLVLMRDRDQASQRKNAHDVCSQVATDMRRFDVALVVAHQDCDETEPAHIGLSETIERELSRAGVSAVAATPAWEIEAWWYLWPEALHEVNRAWERPRRDGTRVGLIRDAKEQLRRDLRPRTRGKPTRDYTESDSPAIARAVRALGLIDEPSARSDSFDRFATSIRDVAF